MTRGGIGPTTPLPAREVHGFAVVPSAGDGDVTGDAGTAACAAGVTGGVGVAMGLDAQAATVNARANATVAGSTRGRVMAILFI